MEKDNKVEKKSSNVIDYDKFAFGMYHDSKRNEWMVVKLGYDIASKTSKVIEIIPSGGPTKDFGIEKMKLEIARELF